MSYEDMTFLSKAGDTHVIEEKEGDVRGLISGNEGVLGSCRAFRPFALVP